MPDGHRIPKANSVAATRPHTTQEYAMSSRNNPDSEQEEQDRREQELREQQQREAAIRDQALQIPGDENESDSPVIINRRG
jgi:hypothetical protein